MADDYSALDSSYFDASSAPTQNVDTGYGAGYSAAGDPNSAAFNPSAGATDLSAPASGVDQNYLNSVNSVLAKDPTGALATGATGSSGSGALGSVSKILGSLGLGGNNSSNKAIVSALFGLLNSAGQAKNVATASKLPSLPALPGGANTPSSGYFTNYSTTHPGMGYAPAAQAAAQPAASYYTYGQGPQQQFFQQVNPNGGPIAPVTGHASGGRVSTPQRFDQGGFALAPTGPAQQPPQTAPQMPRPAPPQQPAVQQPAAPQPPMRPQPPVNPVGSTATAAGGALGGVSPMAPKGPQMPQAPVSTMGQRMQTARGMAPHMASGGQPRAAMNTDGTTYQLPQTQMAQSQLMGVPPSKNLESVLQSMQRKPAMAMGGALSGVPGGPGTSRHIKGAGDGTSDSIPARLANGEYVIDAQAVSMLGNGDNGAGAKKLDEFRKNLRQHKGGALSQGKMAPDAKPVESYMGSKR